jgi:hypothetical protein
MLILKAIYEANWKNSHPNSKYNTAAICITIVCVQLFASQSIEMVQGERAFLLVETLP